MNTHEKTTRNFHVHNLKSYGHTIYHTYIPYIHFVHRNHLIIRLLLWYTHKCNFFCMTTMHLTNIMIHTGGYWCRRLPIGWQMLGSPIYDGHIRVIYVDYLLLSCMPVYMLLYVCYMYMIPSFHHKWHFHIKLVFESRPSNWAPAVLTKNINRFVIFILQ